MNPGKMPASLQQVEEKKQQPRISLLRLPETGLLESWLSVSPALTRLSVCHLSESLAPWPKSGQGGPGCTMSLSVWGRGTTTKSISAPNIKVNDESQPPMTFDVSLSESAGSRSLDGLVRP